MSQVLIPAHRFHNKCLESSHDQLHQHSGWLIDICQNIWDGNTFENQMIPSTDALWRHWKRSCWIIDMWRQADKNITVLQPLNSHGWTITGSHLTIDWDSMGNIEPFKSGWVCRQKDAGQKSRLQVCMSKAVSVSAPLMLESLPVMKEAYWKKNCRKVAFPMPLKNEV